MRKFVLLCLLVVGLVFGGLGWFLNVLSKPLNLSEPVMYTLAPGQSGIATITDFDQKGWLPVPRTVARFWLKLMADTVSIRAGTYELLPGSTLDDVFTLMASGREVQFNISLIEGLTWEQWNQTLQSTPMLVNDLSPERIQLVLDKWQQTTNRRITSLEGVLLADTYRFTSGTKASEIVLRASDAMLSYLQVAWQQRISGLPYDNMVDVLIMASIIEKETALADERAHIAGVFVNRLERNMRLQTDPTVIYGLGKRFDGNLTRQHLRENTPYNTYVNKGLPPGPIAMVGKAAIEAALHPDITDDLYFVAKGDGSHAFSVSLEQHNRAVRQYQLKQTGN